MCPRCSYIANNFWNFGHILNKCLITAFGQLQSDAYQSFFEIMHIKISLRYL